ncbi:MAG TPA: DUF1571 domain-containing protein [Planctomycetaceae bacterium]|nr:DUF1571 domain-containing protein [Planctomycetaceae bacterium]
MSTVIACWSRLGKRWSVRTAAALGLCLAGVAALLYVPPGMFFVTAARPHAHAIEFAAPTVVANLPAAPTQTRPTAPKESAKDSAANAPLSLAPLAANRVLNSVTQLAFALPDRAPVSHALQSADDPNSQILKEHFARLKAGRERFSHIPGYTATLAKQERIGDWLSDEIAFGIKVRHQPFSVFMRWQSGDEAGKEVLYVDGKDDGGLLVHLGGLKGRILPALKIDPFGSLALQHSRYPITKLGILALTDTLIERRELEMRSKIRVRVEQKPDADCDGRHCSIYVFEDADRAQSPLYRKSVQYIDRQWNVPLRVANYTWPEPGQHLEGSALDEATLIEYYMYSDVVADARLTDGDFDRANAEYHFHR